MKSNFLITVILLTLVSNDVSLAPGEHPFLYYSSKDVDDLRQKARTSHYYIFSRLRQAAEEIKQDPHTYMPPKNWTEFSSSWNEIYGNSLIPLAFYSVLNTSDHEAFEMAKTMLERFSNLRNWRCALDLNDDVPVAHSLVAVATAYDFLWDRLEEKQRQLIAYKIVKVSLEMYERSFKKWWGKAYIQNHVTTNYVALLTGALAVENVTKDAYLWKRRAHEMLNRTMFLLGFVEDGSLEEGVSYGSYTSRSLTQYIALAKRHINVDLTKNAWLRNHFWFLYRTIHPKFDQTIGIADSNGMWFYGPESQLVFLDSMVLKNGQGNWLAKQIERVRKDGRTLFLAKPHRFATLHSEFLFYDHKNGERPPEDVDIPTLHVFEDWGVVVFGCGAGILCDYNVDRFSNNNSSFEPAVVKISVPATESKINTNKDEGIVRISSLDSSKSNQLGISEQGLSFLSFKCGVLHGRAINKIINNKPWPWIKGWRSLNPGHEHPDHGSFTFYPNGVPFITEALYGPKYTWLNNALSFSSSSSEPGRFTGQLSESERWLMFKGDSYWKAKGSILAALQDNERVYIAGEYSNWYDKKLGLKNIYRTLVLIRSDLLLVCDAIFTNANSTVNKMAAFFHNRFSPFSIKEDNGKQFADVVQQGKTHRVHWVSSAGKTRAQSQDAKFKAEYGKRKTNFINITTPVVDNLTTVVYIFSGPDLQVKELQLTNKLKDFVTITLMIKDTFYKITTVLKPKQAIPLQGMRFSDYVDITTVENRNSSYRRGKHFALFGFLTMIGFLSWRFLKMTWIKTFRKVRKMLVQLVERLLPLNDYH